MGTGNVVIIDSSSGFALKVTLSPKARFLLDRDASALELPLSMTILPLHVAVALLSATLFITCVLFVFLPPLRRPSTLP